VCHKSALVFKLLDGYKKKEKFFNIEVWKKEKSFNIEVRKYNRKYINQYFCQWSHYAIYATPIIQNQTSQQVDVSGKLGDKIKNKQKEENKRANKNWNEESIEVCQVRNLYNNMTIGTTDFTPIWLSIISEYESVKIVKRNDLKSIY
jgi:hypothetical protein